MCSKIESWHRFVKYVWLFIFVVSSCWQAHLPYREGGTSPYPGSISVYFAYKGSEKGGGAHAPCAPCLNLPMTQIDNQQHSHTT